MFNKLFNFLHDEETPEREPVFDETRQAKRYDRIRHLNVIRSELMVEFGREPTISEIWEKDSDATDD